VPRGIAPKPIVQSGRVRVLADFGADELAIAAGVGDAADDVTGEVGKIRLAPRDQIRTRLSKQVLHAIRDEPGPNQGERQAQPSGVKFPELAAPDERLGRARRNGGTGHKEERDDGNDDDWRTGTAENQGRRLDRLGFGEGKTARGC
jgi:hypothetical protein